MEILKDISKDRLVIMVTHNPELAEKYSTRIIRMLDGVITGDSSPLTNEEINNESKSLKTSLGDSKKTKKPSMSFATSFGLSLKNLFTKKGRTILTSFAGSIGIIGIALIYAVSQGMTTYIDTVQEETLSSYPLTLEAQHMDIGTLMQTFMGSAQSGNDHDNDAVYQKGMIYDMINAMNSMETKENDLKAKKETILALEEKIKNSSSNTEELLNNLQVLIEIPNEELCEKSDDKEVVKVDENFKKLSNVRNSIYSRYR